MRAKGIFKRLNAYISLCLVMLLHVGVVTAQNTSPLCFTARNGSVTVRFDIKNVTHTIQYSTDSLNWNTYTSNSDVVLNSDQSVYFRAESNQTVATAFGSSVDDLCSRFYFSSSNNGTIEADGDVMSLYGTDSSNLQLQPYAFANMFKECNILTSAPILSATNLANCCYWYMFQGSSIMEAPSLPATTLYHSCYRGMFEFCDSLIETPLLPATNLAVLCYAYMFNDCDTLSNINTLPASILADSSYYSMFSNCKSIATPPSLPATKLAAECYRDMFINCSSLSSAPLLPADTLAVGCYRAMLAYCTSLHNPPVLPATKLANRCYQDLFMGCSSLSSAPVLPADTLFECCYLSMFYNCNSLTSPPELPATLLADYCYGNMFYGCSSLAIPPALPATTLANGCYHDMFRYCYGLLFCPELPATNLAEHCYERMFYYCTSLSSLPSLPATTLPNFCYYRMFWGCSSLQVNTSGSGKQWRISATTVGENIASSMFHGTIGTMISTPSINTTYRVASVVYHTVTANANDITKGSVSGAGSFERGKMSTLNANPNSHCHFIDWNNGDTSSTISLCVIKDTILTANFAIDQHTVTVSGEHGQVVGGGTYDYGSTVTLTASKDPHYHFVRWSDGNTSNPRIITIIGDSTFNAIFEIDQHTITATGNNGEVAGGGVYDYGSTVNLTAVPNNHYHFVRWSDGDTVNPRTITVDSNRTYMAVFEGNIQTITVNGTNGTVSGSGNYHFGTTTTISAAANQHYHFVRWSDGNTNNPRTITVSGDNVYTAVIEIDKHYVSAICANGTISGTGTYDYGSTATLTANANPHYHFVRWSDGDTTNPRSITVYSNCTYKATFEIDKHNVNVSGPNGVVTGGGTYDYGKSVTLTATADEHYHFVGWSDGDMSNPRTIVVSGDLVYTALFEIDKHIVSGSGRNGVVLGLGEYDYGTTVTLTAIPDEHYCDVTWSDGDSVLSKSFVITEDINYTADFAKCQYVVNATCEHGEVTGSGVYENPEIVTLIAYPDEGYKFIEWSDGNDYNPRVFVVEGDLEVEAICEVMTGVEDVEESVAFYYVNGRVVNPEGVMLRVYSTEGKMVKSGDGDIETEGLPAGMYMVVDERGNSIKIVIMHNKI